MFNWKLFGRGKKTSPSSQHAPDQDLGFLGWDMHSHLIAGIDDGAEDLDQSLTMIRELKSIGYTGLVTTPHIKSDHYPNSRENIQEGLERLKEAMESEGIEMPIRAAAEYYIDEHFMKLLRHRALMPIMDNRVLVEFSFMFAPHGLQELMFEIQSEGYVPILAHPERYSYFLDRMHVFEDLKDRGCMLQLNLLSLTGYYGKPIRKMAHALLEAGMYDYAGTDLHHGRHLAHLHSLLEGPYLDKMRAYPFQNLQLAERASKNPS